MFGRVLGTSLVQVTRSIAILLFPLSFLTIIAWTTAGSTSGNTGDPLRAALWLWLGAHHIPFNLIFAPSQIVNHLSYLPIGGIIFPIFAIRSGVSRTIERLGNDTSLTPLARTLFSIQYTIITIAISYFSTTEGVRPLWYIAPILLLPITFLTASTVERRVSYGQAVLYGSRAIALLLGLSSLLLAASIFLHLGTIKNITTVLEPGIVGGFILLLLNILYIPNAAIATLAYLSGSGFAVGNGTLVAPWSFHINTLPAFPLLGALPTGKFMPAFFGITCVIIVGAVLTSWTINFTSRVLVQSLAISLIICTVISYLASGSLITSNLSAFGVSPWKFTITVICELAFGVVLAVFVPRIIKRS